MQRIDTILWDTVMITNGPRDQEICVLHYDASVPLFIQRFDTIWWKDIQQVNEDLKKECRYSKYDFINVSILCFVNWNECLYQKPTSITIPIFVGEFDTILHK